MGKAKVIIIGLGIFLCAITGTVIYRYFFKSWTPYYQEKLYKEPRPLLVKAVELLPALPDKDKKALDLGAGAGNDTAFLLKKGWKVWANDAQEEAITIIAARKDIQSYVSRLTLIHSSFIDLKWNELPDFNLIYAGYSLPFIEPSHFRKVWKQIVAHVKPGGLFGGHLFGPDHGAFNWWVKRNMTFFAKEQILELFKNFKIEFFEEVHKKNEQGLWDHIFEVIARKL